MRNKTKNRSDQIEHQNYTKTKNNEHFKQNVTDTQERQQKTTVIGKNGKILTKLSKNP